MKQFSPACERNKDVILPILQEVLPRSGTVLEIGSGTGQHAVCFAAGLPGLIWQPTDLPGNFPSIRAWSAEAGLPNLHEPLALDLFAASWPVTTAAAIVCINTIHIIAWEAVENLFAGAAGVLAPGGVMFVYGPYCYAARPLEPSNEAFDQWLKACDPVSGVRDFEAVNALAQKNDLLLAGDRAMPANNRAIWWEKVSPRSQRKDG